MKQKTKLKDYKVVKSHYKKKIKIPSDWIFEPLQSKINVLSGFAFNSQNFDKENGIPLIRIRDLANINTQIHYNGDFSKEFLINAGDLLVGMDGEFSPHLWKGGDALLNQRVCKITTASEKILHQRFIYYTIKKELHHYKLINIGTTVIHLSKSDIENISIPFPTILEQQKIASILSGIDALIESTQHIIEKTEKLKKGLMQKLLTRGIGHTKFKKMKWLFGKEIEIPTEWDYQELGKLTKITDGSHYSPTKVSNGFPLATVKNVKGNLIDIDSCYQISKEDYEQLVKDGNQPNIGDVLFTKDGTVGKTIVFKQTNKIILLSSLAIIRKSVNLDSDYCNYALQSKFMTKHLAKYFGGTAIKRIILHHLSKYEFPIPQLPEQTKIASILSGVDAYIQKNQQYKERLEKLKKGLMQKLLTGQIRVKV